MTHPVQHWHCKSGSTMYVCSLCISCLKAVVHNNNTTSYLKRSTYILSTVLVNQKALKFQCNKVIYIPIGKAFWEASYRETKRNIKFKKRCTFCLP